MWKSCKSMYSSSSWTDQNFHNQTLTSLSDAIFSSTLKHRVRNWTSILLTVTFNFTVLVGLSAGKHKDNWTDFHETWIEDGSQPRSNWTNFWHRFDKGSNPGIFSHFVNMFIFFSLFLNIIMHRSWWEKKTGIFRRLVSMSKYNLLSIQLKLLHFFTGWFQLHRFVVVRGRLLQTWWA